MGEQAIKIRRFPRYESELDIPIADITPEKLRWLWGRRIPFGMVTLLEGDPNVGKSLLSVDIAARVSAGRRMPFSKKSRPPANVIILSTEDSRAKIIRKRLAAAGANLNRVIVPKLYRKNGDLRFEIPRGLGQLANFVKRNHAALLIIDPLVAFVPPDVNIYKDQDVRRALARLSQLAERVGFAVLAIRHLNKKVGLTPMYRGGGSIGIIGAARSSLIVAPDRQDSAVRILASIKSNLSPPPDALAFEIVGTEDGSAKIEWRGKITCTADELLDPRSNPMSDAYYWLRRTLAQGSLPANEIERLARKAGIAKHTLDRAKSRLGVISRKGRGADRQWTWSLSQKSGGLKDTQTKSESLDNPRKG